MLELFGRFRLHLLMVLMVLLPLLALFMGRAKPGRGPVGGAMAHGASSMQAAGMVGTGVLEGLWQEYVVLRDLSKENERLRQQLARYEEERARLIGVLQENARLRQMLDFKDRRPDLKLRVARVIGRDITPYFRVLRVKLDLASFDAPVKPKMAVVSHEGVVGQVVEVYDDKYAEIMLISDPRSKIDIMTQRNRTRGMVHGLGHAKDYEASLAYLRRKDEIVEGDQVVTSGKGGIFPQELLVGRVKSVVKRAWGLEQQAIIEPTADFGRLEEVFIVTGERIAGQRP